MPDLTPLLDLPALLGPELAKALAERGFTELTAVQEAVLDPALVDRDLRLTSQTGSGKTVALGIALRHLVVGETAAVGGAARPRAMVVTPTRELAHQVEQELSWLYAPLGVKVVTTTGGSSARDERRALGTGPGVIVGTPGRLLDHLSRKSIDASQVAAVVLDEADRMLDLGFREDLLAILGYPPAEHRTHLVSATFPHGVRALADRVQQNAAHVEGTRLGAANVDIVHRIVLVDPKERFGAIVNILLAKPDEQALVFARTRADVASLAKELHGAKFSVGSLSGEMDQVARNRAMAAFKSGTLRVLVATDVAARGIDVQDIAHVIHADAPGDADTYTHRSGRTGRAGRKGMSSVLVTPTGLRGAAYLLGRAGVVFRIEPVPSADEIRKASDERLFASLTADDAEPEGEGSTASAIPPRVAALADRLAEGPHVTRTLARLLQRVRGAEACEPLDLRRIEPPSDRGRAGERPRPADRELPRAPTPGKPLPRPTRDHDHPHRAPAHARSEGAPPARAARGPRMDDGREWASFRVTWGADQGADARRLLAIVCRRGGIRGSDVGAIRVGSIASTIDVAAEVAGAFAQAVETPDPREPNVRIVPAHEVGEPTEHAAPRAHRPEPSRGAGPAAPAPSHRPSPYKKTHPPVERHYKPVAPTARAPHSRGASAPAAFKGDAYKPSAHKKADADAGSRSSASRPHAHAPRKPHDERASGYKGKRERPAGAPAREGHGGAGHAPPRRPKS